MRNGRRESVVCDLCLERPRAAVLGEPVRRERIQSVAGAANVRRAWPVPAAEPSPPRSRSAPIAAELALPRWDANASMPLRLISLDVAANSSNRLYTQFQSR